MKPGGGGKPSGELLELINRDFGSFERFIEELRSAAATQFGSGWAWLACEWLPSHLTSLRLNSAITLNLVHANIS